MNITILANRDLASNVALNRLLPALAGQHRLQVFLSSHVGSGSELPLPLKQLKFFEQSLFNTLLFPALATSPGRARLQSFDGLAKASNTPIKDLNKINSAAGLAEFSSSNPELVLSIRYGGILREQAIAVPTFGVLNLHSGLLPGYRGVMATFYAMLNGEIEIGTTLHSISDPGIDTGDIFHHTRMPIDYQHSYLWNVLQLYSAGIDGMVAVVQQRSQGVMPVCAPQPSAGNYYSFPTPELLHDFDEKGLRLYDVDEILEFAQYYLEP